MQSFKTPYDKLTSKQRREKQQLKYIHVSTPVLGVQEQIAQGEDVEPQQVVVYNFSKAAKGSTYRIGRKAAKRVLSQVRM